MKNPADKRKVLIVDDTRTNLTLMRLHLEKMNLLVLEADNAPSGLEIAHEQRPDLILLDIMMPDMDGYECCQQLKNNPVTAGIPVVFISAKDQTVDKVKGLGHGAVDYITKPFEPAELRARVQIILQMVALQEKLLDQANTDELTSLGNRRAFLEVLDREVAHAREHNELLSVLMIDIDHFKHINDTYGHLGGDAVLRQLADILRHHGRSRDYPARYGGEEFVVILPGASHEQARKSAEELRHAIHNTRWRLSVENVTITASIGLATMTSQELLFADELVQRADKAMYLAKNQGRDCVVSWSDLADKQFNSDQPRENIQSLKLQVDDLSRRIHDNIIAGMTALVRALGAKNPYLQHHAARAQTYALAVADEFQLDRAFKQTLAVAAALHDVGKFGVDNAVLFAPGTLTPEQYEQMKRHPLISLDILEPLRLSSDILNIIKHHHEHFDGTGYPHGLAESDIPFGARLLAVADAFDAMTANPVSGLRSADQALQEINQLAGSQFDPEVAHAFSRAFEKASSDWPLVDPDPDNSISCLFTE